MQKHYPAIYVDDYDQEQTKITLAAEGHILSMTIRGTQFQGFSFSQFYVWPPDEHYANIGSFSLKEAYSPFNDPSRPWKQFLTNYTLQWAMPVQIVEHQDFVTQGMLYGTQISRIPHKDDDFGYSYFALLLHVKEYVIEIANPGLQMRKALFQIQQQLPPRMYLKCCQFCMLSAEEPFMGTGTLCFRRKKDQFRALKYAPNEDIESKDDLPEVALWDEQVNYVQEIYLCSEFEPDLVLLSEMQTQEE